MKRYLDTPLPHFTVMAVPYDTVTKNVALMWRGENVRSAKNCLSTPAGLLEHGEPFEDGLLRELEEEMGVSRDLCSSVRFHTIYRNDNGDGLDWVIGVWSVAVTRLEQNMRNMEPDKHDELVLMSLEALAAANPRLVSGRHKINGQPIVFASNLQSVLRQVARELLQDT